MPKNILIFSDGTGQVGGMKPDQRLSNVYKLYRAARPGPSSPIKPSEQVCFYDAGLGAGEVGGLTFQRVRNVLSAAVGTGIDENVIDCYEKIISYYEPGDRILVFGFSRGAYTARAVANVMNLCGIPTKMPDGSAVPRYGAPLRKIASDAVNFVYNHGNGYSRGQEPYFTRREELGRRFRRKYGSFVPGAEEDVQGNVQPTFIGVFDTVAALGNVVLRRVGHGIFHDQRIHHLEIRIGEVGDELPLLGALSPDPFDQRGEHVGPVAAHHAFVDESGESARSRQDREQRCLGECDGCIAVVDEQDLVGGERELVPSTGGDAVQSGQILLPGLAARLLDP